MTTSTMTEAKTDEQLQRDVFAELKWDARVLPNEIGVSVKNGIVTLTGEVDWQYQKIDAERVVSRLAGVKGVNNLITVRPRVSPSGVKKMIEDALVRSVKTDAERITVEVEGSKVILKGTVRSWAEREEAERAAWQAPGIAEVSNQIVIAP